MGRLDVGGRPLRVPPGGARCPATGAKSARRATCRSGSCALRMISGAAKSLACIRFGFGPCQRRLEHAPARLAAMRPLADSLQRDEEDCRNGYVAGLIGTAASAHHVQDQDGCKRGLARRERRSAGGWNTSSRTPRAAAITACRSAARSSAAGGT